jgi:tRNA pseudouridine55 synthase
MNGALLIRKDSGITSFGVIEVLKRHLRDHHQIKPRDLPKLGHGGTLDPFATGLLIVLVGRGVKLARYFLGATKGYEGLIRFGETTVPGDPTSPISETSENLPKTLEEIQDLTSRFTRQPYLQTPPMHSAKKKNGRPLYELAREGIEVEREPKLCHIYEFNVDHYTSPEAKFRLKCSSGTYIRTLAQDMGRLFQSVAMLNTLNRTQSGVFRDHQSWSLPAILEANQSWDELPCWVPFDDLLKGYPSAEASEAEHRDLLQGKQAVIFSILKRTIAPLEKSSEHNDDCVAIYSAHRLVAIARKVDQIWGLERVLT